MLALTGQHFIIDYNEQAGTLPGFVKGFTNVARDEHRHVAFGARFLRDMAREDPRHGEAIQRTLVEVGAGGRRRAAPEVVPRAPTTSALFGAASSETRAFALQALERRLKVDRARRRGVEPPAGREPAEGRRSRRAGCQPAVSDAGQDAPRSNLLVVSVVREEFRPTLPRARSGRDLARAARAVWPRSVVVGVVALALLCADAAPAAGTGERRRAHPGRVQPAPHRRAAAPTRRGRGSCCASSRRARALPQSFVVAAAALPAL